MLSKIKTIKSKKGKRILKKVKHLKVKHSTLNSTQSRTMVRRKGRQPRRRRRARNGAFLASTLRTKHVYLWSDMSGTSGKWYMNFTIAALTSSFQSAFDEFRIMRITCHYRPNNASTDTGLYVGVLLDQNGFGKFDLGSEVAWFRTLATFPGSKIRPRSQTSTYVWYPTEPASKEWYRYQTDKDHVIATLYIADNGKETLELGGIMELNVTLKARGLYWNAAVKSIMGDHPQGHSPQTTTVVSPVTDLVDDFEQLEA